MDEKIDGLKRCLAWKLFGEGIGSAKIRKIYRELYKLAPDEREREIKRTVSEIPTDFTQSLKRLGVRIIIQGEKFYPYRLECFINNPECKMQNPPVILFGIGDLNLLNYKKIITIVGTRRMSSYGERVIEDLFSRAGEDVVYMSGLAYGIDSRVHKVALDNGIKTIAIVAGGIDQGFPKKNYWLYKRICSEGLIIAEFPPGRPAVKGMYPMRNRLMAVLADSVVVIESGREGGSLLTAKYGLQYGKPVYAVPGSVFNRASVGANDLLDSPHVSVLTQVRVLQLLGVTLSSRSRSSIPRWLNRVFNTYGNHHGLSCEAICSHCDKLGEVKLTITQLEGVLNQLSLQGVLLQKNGKYILNS
jgi:DNA processing protein